MAGVTTTSGYNIGNYELLFRVSLNLKVSVFKNAWISCIGSFNYCSSSVTEKYLLKTVSFVRSCAAGGAGEMMTSAKVT